ncbi:MAG: hypothetical protein KGJ02_08585 [Verrucomicrobiota bacterium]|nr:hypothetical protein [Verrucomicrobiota bacterium]
MTFTTGTLVLSTGSNLMIDVSGNATLPAVQGTTNENISIDIGGSAALGNIGPHIADVSVTTDGSIAITGPIASATVEFQGDNGIANQGSGSHSLTTTEDATFDAPSGNVGSIADPIAVAASGKVYTGTQYNGLAAFSGTTVDNTIHVLSADPPAILIFNGIYLINNFQPTLGSAAFIILPYVQGIYSQNFNLSSDFYLRSDPILAAAYHRYRYPLLSWIHCNFWDLNRYRKRFGN